MVDQSSDTSGLAEETAGIDESKASSGSPEKKPDPPIPEGTEDVLQLLTNEIRNWRTLGKNHTFWEAQPVCQFDDVGKDLPEGPIKVVTPLSHVKQHPYDLPKDYEWVTCDLDSEEMLDKVHKFLSKNYAEEGVFRWDYSNEFLSWCLKPPGQVESWHVGVRAKESKNLVGFIAAIPAKIRIRDEHIQMAEINFLCVHNKLRTKRLAPVLIMEMKRRVQLENISQAAYTTNVLLPTPVAICQYWHRSLNPKKLRDIGFLALGEKITLKQEIKLCKLPESPATPGFRKMEEGDVFAVTKLIKEYLKQFTLSPCFNNDDVSHWFLPRKGVVDSFVVVSEETSLVTDFCSFYMLPSTLTGNEKYPTLTAACLYYYVSTDTPLTKLVNDCLIVAQQSGFDLFSAVNVMNNQLFLKELKFRPGDGKLHYHLFNYRLKHPLKPSAVGLLTI